MPLTIPRLLSMWFAPVNFPTIMHSLRFVAQFCKPRTDELSQRVSVRYFITDAPLTAYVWESQAGLSFHVNLEITQVRFLKNTITN